MTASGVPRGGRQRKDRATITLDVRLARTTRKPPSPPTYDNLARKRVHPTDRRGFIERFVDRYVWPRRHGNWWNFDAAEGKTKSAEELYAGLARTKVEEAKTTLDHVKEIAQGAVDRAAAADRRATTIAGTVAIAASFTLSGGGLALDEQKLKDPAARTWFAIALCFTTASFVISAFFALRGLVAARIWLWAQPTDLPTDAKEPEEKRLGMRAAHLLEDYAGNWEISDFKNRLVDLALLWLLAALFGIVALAILLATQAA